tara:strand:+ start:238 stop:468 length:231 start_codon:yes stop_codon:yes gene_type:complete
MHVDVQQVVVVYGLHLGVHVKYSLNYGHQAAMDPVHVHVVDVIISKAQAADHIIKNKLLQHQVVHIECVQVECTDV